MSRRWALRAILAVTSLGLLLGVVVVHAMKTSAAGSGRSFAVLVAPARERSSDAARPPAFSLSVAPAIRAVVAGAQANYVITIGRHRTTGAVAFSITGLPTGATASFTPQSTAASSTNLTITTAAATHVGSYVFTVIGASRTYRTSTTARLVVTIPAGAPFSITGSSDRRLAPGVTGLLDLSLTNPSAAPLQVTSLRVSASRTSAPSCSIANYTVGQFSGSYPLTIPAHATRTLSQLGIAPARLPRVSMLNLPVNQDACKNASVLLDYTGTGRI